MNDLLVSLKNGVRFIKINRSSKRNAISVDMYKQLAKILNEDAKNEEVVCTNVMGVGDYFSSGNELVPSREVTSEEVRDDVQQFIEALINYPKLLIAIVNGPAIGIGVTMLPLFDIVYASDRATFHTPFVKLGLCAEGCSSYMFPRIMGKSRACEMLLLGRKFSAREACDARLVSEVVPHKKLPELLEKVSQYGKLPIKGLLVSKGLINANLREKLHEVNKREMISVFKCVNDEAFLNAVTVFMSRKSKL